MTTHQAFKLLRKIFKTRSDEKQILLAGEGIVNVPILFEIEEIMGTIDIVEKTIA